MAKVYIIQSTPALAAAQSSNITRTFVWSTKNGRAIIYNIIRENWVHQCRSHHIYCYYMDILVYIILLGCTRLNYNSTYKRVVMRLDELLY